MGRARWFRPPYPLLVVFLGTMCVLGGALAWLCRAMLEQDRQLASQRVQERLEQAADRIAGTLAVELREFDRWMEPAPEGVALLVLTEQGISVRPAGRLLYLPPSGEAGPAVDVAFAAAERSEFQEHDPAAAVEDFRRLASSSKTALRGAALVRLGRNLRKMGRYDEALRAYQQLSLLTDVRIEGIPADLTALDARCGVLDALGRREELRQTALLMDAGLRSCRWGIRGAAWDFHREQAVRWAQPAALTDREQQALVLSRAAEWAARLGTRPAEAKGRRVVAFEGGSALISWTASAGHLEAVLAGAAPLNALWAQSQAVKGVSAALIDGDGSVLLGTAAKGRRTAVRSMATAGLPATLVAMQSDPVADTANSAVRRRLLLAGFALLGTILLAGSGFILHSMARERAIARLQSDFVAAVSHEFRTPLTALRQMSEMLLRDRIANEADRRQSYEILFHASERLQRLVESLLDFGRMEASAFQYRFEEIDVRALVDHIVEGFRTEGAQGHEIVLRHGENLAAARADRDAIGVALWNLLDNAVKYSPGSSAVWVETKREDGAVAIVVRDEGLGIESAEQAAVFERFVRGSAAQKSTIKGTGIGLSMARHIVRAHGGDIRVRSEPGKGSTFTIVLPAKAEA